MAFPHLHELNETVKYKYSDSSLKKLEMLHPKMIQFAFAIADLIDAKIIYGMRTDAEQMVLYAEGKTTFNGVNKRSAHQLKEDGFCYALDILPLPFGVNMYDDSDPENKLRWAQFDGMCHAVAHSLDFRIKTGFKWRDNMMKSLQRKEADNTLPDGNHVEMVL